MDTAARVQILHKADCISHNTNSLEKGMNPIGQSSALRK